MKTNETPVDVPTLTVSSLRRALASAPDLPITVIWPDGEAIEAHFHVTEIGRVQRDFVDCGGTMRQIVTCLLQTWVGDDLDHRITAGSLLKAFHHADPILQGEDLPVELEYEACNVVQLKVLSALVEGEHVAIRLGKKRTDCLARELCVPSSRSGAGASCC